ncbi:hypothetical protein [Pedobacter agri]|uniref:hypothetical protein n=1 Tax=Pedobacter agri TaxID=454586 RepID=UPI002788BBD3|nr:hypothetical protein [Pedobacter agri]MDQ1138832.1 hypothetical protein [Pedobacter agri]
MFSLFILLVIIRLMNKYLDNDQFKLADNPNTQNGNIENYFPIVFHFVIIVLIVISFFNTNILTDDRIHALVSDGIFQFVSTLLIVIISIINPFVSFSPEARAKLQILTDQEKFSAMRWLLRDKNWQLLKALACILIVAYFISEQILVIPSLKQGTISGITIILILFFVFSNIIQLIKDPVMFKKKTLFRLSMLYRSFKLSFFISIGLIAAVFLFSALAQIDTSKTLKIEAMVLMVYNVVMAYNEFKILRA